MPGNLVTLTASAICTHAGSVSIAPGSTRVRAGGAPVATVGDVFSVAACPFQIPLGAGTKPQPCVTLRWVAPSVRVKVEGKPVVLQTSSGVCQSVEQIPQGPPSVIVTQLRVRGQ
jgi:uncharacterized Zn-binding protein involved in type VI secretion